MDKNSVKGDGLPLCGDRHIWTFYEWAAVLAPLALMLSHWYIFYVFSQNTQEVMEYPKANEICIAWIYSILYLYVPLMLVPATYFFKWCNLFRIPYFYFLFINAERFYYGSWFCTNEMVDTHYILIYCVCIIYVYELIILALKYRNEIVSFVKDCFHDEDDDKVIDMMMEDLKRMEEEENEHV